MEADIIHSHLLDGRCTYLVTETVLNLMIKFHQTHSTNDTRWAPMILVGV